MNLEEIQAVIDSAKARGTDQLASYVRERLPDASDRDIHETVDLPVGTEVSMETSATG